MKSKNIEALDKLFAEAFDELGIEDGAYDNQKEDSPVTVAINSLTNLAELIHTFRPSEEELDERAKDVVFVVIEELCTDDNIFIKAILDDRGFYGQCSLVMWKDYKEVFQAHMARKLAFDDLMNGI